VGQSSVGQMKAHGSQATGTRTAINNDSLVKGVKGSVSCPISGVWSYHKLSLLQGRLPEPRPQNLDLGHRIRTAAGRLDTGWSVGPCTGW
jgi:hypothetical protein